MDLNTKKKFTLENFNYFLIVISLIFAPFTQIRIAKIGVSEIAMILFVLSILFKQRYKLNLKINNYFIFTRFWLIFLLLIFMGMTYNIFSEKSTGGGINLILIDTIAYLMSASVCLTLELLIYNEKNFNINLLLKRVFYFSSLLFFLLFTVSRFTDSIFGYTLLQVNNFRPLATNVHHPAMSMTPLPFLGLKVFLEEKNKFLKMLSFFLIASNIYIAFHMASSKLIIGLLLGSLLLAYFYIMNKFKEKKERVLSVLISIILIIVVLIIFRNTLLMYYFELFHSIDGGGARASLWTSSVSRIMSSPLVGYGPGPHAILHNSINDDAHQSLLTVGLQGGIFAIILLVLLLTKITLVTSKKEIMLASISGILVYALGGDILRRLPMWIFLILIYYNSFKKSK